MKQQRGFTLIELVMVIVILGILAAVALPKFVDLSTDAGNAATAGVAGALSSASSMNYAAKAAGKLTATTLNDTNANTCKTAVLGPFVSGVTLADAVGAPASSTVYNISAGVGGPAVTCVSSPATTTFCTLQGSKGVSTQVPIICTGP